MCSLLLTSTVSAFAQARATARWAPKPKWVDEVAVDYAAPAAGEAMRDGTATLLADTRIRLTASGVERYSRHVDLAVNQAGVSALGELQIEFSPEYQHLVLHRAALIRAGQIIDETKIASLRMLDQEPDSANRVYSGAATALLVLSDVRPGDAVDVSYTVSGSNPILGGRYAGHVRLGADAPARHIHVEISSAVSRPPLHWSVRGAAPAPRDVTVDGQRSLTWDLKDVQPRPDEDRIPSDFAAPPELELSEFANWSEVATWATSLYPPAPDAALEAKAKQLRASAPDLETAVLHAIHFVQDDVRYLSISLGPHSVKPHVPKVILGQRFGDCKDKSYLLVELLRELGVEAHVALADSELRAHLRESLPSAFAFDHVITVIDLQGKRYYVDATWAFQGGTLGHLAPPDVGAALVVAPTSTELSDVPEPPLLAPPLSALSEYQVDGSGSATMTVTTTYLGEEADGQRARLASKSEADVSHAYLNFYEKAFPGIALGKPLQVRDDRDSDVVTFVETYSIPAFWRSDARSLVPDLIWDYLVPPDSQRRETPLFLSNRVWIREVQRITLPFDPEPDPSEQRFEDPAARVTRSLSYDERVVSATHEYRSFADAVPLAGLAHHLQFLADARKQVGLDLAKREESADSNTGNTLAARSARRLSDDKANWWPFTLLACGVLGAALALVRVMRRLANRRRPAQARAGARGDLPQNARHAHSLSDAVRDFTRSACSCGAELPPDAVELAELSFQDRTLHAARAVCSTCGTLRRAYFELPEPDHEHES